MSRLPLSLLLLLFGSAAAVPSAVRTPPANAAQAEASPSTSLSAADVEPPPPSIIGPIVGPNIAEPGPPGTAVPTGPNPEQKSPGISRHRRAADNEKSQSLLSSESPENSNNSDVSAPAEIRLPHDIEIVPGHTAPPGYDIPTEDGEEKRKEDSPDIPAPEPTMAGVPPPAETPDETAGDNNTTEHINYEGLYYTMFAENDTAQEVRHFHNVKYPS